MTNIQRLLHDIFHIGLVNNSRLPYEFRQRSWVLILVEGWYQGRHGKIPVVIYLLHSSHWLFSFIDFNISEKIFDLTNCKNKSLRELPLFNLQIFIPPLPEVGGGYTVLPLSVCPSVLPSVLPSFRLSFRPSKIFFVALFSVTVDGRNLIFGHKHHIGIPYCG